MAFPALLFVFFMPAIDYVACAIEAYALTTPENTTAVTSSTLTEGADYLIVGHGIAASANNGNDNDSTFLIGPTAGLRTVFARSSGNNAFAISASLATYANGGSAPIGFAVRYTPGAGEEMEWQAWGGDATGTGYLRAYALDLTNIPVGGATPLRWHEEGLNSDTIADTPTSGYETIGNSLVFTAPHTGDYLVTVTTELVQDGTETASDLFDLRLRLNGSTVSGTPMVRQVDNRSGGICNYLIPFRVINLTAGSNTLLLEMNGTSSNGNVGARRTSIHVIAASAFTDTATSVQGDTDPQETLTGTVDSDPAGISLTIGDGTDDWLLCSTAQKQANFWGEAFFLLGAGPTETPTNGFGQSIVDIGTASTDDMMVEVGFYMAPAPAASTAFALRLSKVGGAGSNTYGADCAVTGGGDIAVTAIRMRTREHIDDIDDLGANHHWEFDGNSNDRIGSANGTNTSIGFAASPIAREVTNSAQVNAVGDRISIPTTTDINNSVQDRKAVCGWFLTTAVQLPFTRIYGEGNNTTNFQLTMGFGNIVTLEVRDGASFQIQVYTDRALAPNRAYHLCAIFEGNSYANRVDLFLDGVRQTNAVPADRQPDDASLAARGVAEFADPAGTVGLDGTALVMVAPAQTGTSSFQHWATWDGAPAVLTDSEVRVDLFERGALADVTISSGTEASMQTALDVYADTLRGDAPVCIEIEAVTGGGDFTLDLDNITFNELASVHVRYNGASDTLTIRNTNGADASIGSAPFGGAIQIVTEQTITVTVLDASTFAAVENARVRLEADTGGPLTAGTVLIANVLTNASGVASATFDYPGDQPVTGRARKATSSPHYKTGALSGSVTGSGYDATVFLVPDE